MKTLRLSTLAALALFILALTFSSCRKRQAQDDNEQGTAADNNLAENIASDIETMGGQVSGNSALTTYKTSGGALSGDDLKLAATCATITGSGTQLVTVDFGTGCTGLDGRVRSGKLIYNFSASAAGAVYYRNPGFSMSVSSQNYVVDGNQVNIINKTVTNTTAASIPQGPNPGINLSWFITAHMAIVKSNGNSVSWTCSRTKELVNTNDQSCYNGQATAIDWSQAQVKLNGSASGVNAKGENFTAVAANLTRNFTCSPDAAHPRRHPFVSGTVVYTPGSRPARLIDFGSGACDLNATVNVKNHTYNITLP